MVERYIHIVDAGGSNPSVPTNELNYCRIKYMSKERTDRNRRPKDISPDERVARDFVKELKRVYRPQGLSTLLATYSPASPREIFEAIQRAHSPQENSG